MTFKELAIDQTFDFIEDGSFHNSFYEPCVKTGKRSYSALNDDGSFQFKYGVMKVGSINCTVFHVDKYKGVTK